MSELGGFYGRYYLGHVTLVHTSGGRTVGGVMELPVYSHSPVETVSSQDVEGLSQITAALATEW